MKVRNGFVSNSSSSSFICVVCGENQSGWDISLEEAGMFECQKGHVVCQSHLSEKDQDKFTEIRENDEEDDFDLESVDPEMCPVCNLEVLPDYLLLQYVLKDIGMTKEVVLSKIRSKFSSYNDFNDFIK
jgi:hypothetical protein